ncbi:MAG: HPr kinase/phosphorylase, partial [Sphingopyxis sp.]
MNPPGPVLAASCHGTAVVVDGRAVLLLGPSGAGKSDLALRLHAVGADLIVDDLLTLSAHNGVIHAHAPARQPALVHVRGIG